MEEIIKKAIEGGFPPMNSSVLYMKSYIMNPLFWQALGKSCGWKIVLSHGSAYGGDEEGCTHDDCQEWYNIAIIFYGINLSEGWDSAIKYLEVLTKGRNN